MEKEYELVGFDKSNTFYSFNGEYFYYCSGKTFYYKKNLEDSWASITLYTGNYTSDINSFAVWNGSYFVVMSYHSVSSYAGYISTIDPATMTLAKGITLFSGSVSSYTSYNPSHGITDDYGNVYFACQGEGIIKVSGTLEAPVGKYTLDSSGAYTTSSSSDSRIVFKSKDKIYFAGNTSSYNLSRITASEAADIGTITVLSSTAAAKNIIGYVNGYWIKYKSYHSIEIGKGDNYDDVTEWKVLDVESDLTHLDDLGSSAEFTSFSSMYSPVPFVGSAVQYIQDLNYYVIGVKDLGTSGKYGIIYTDDLLDFSKYKLIYDTGYPYTNYPAVFYDSKLYFPESTIVEFEELAPPEGPILGLEVSEMTTTYRLNSDFVFDGVVKGVWVNTTRKITGYTVSTPDLSSLGTKKVTISYTDDLGTTVSTTYSILVVAVKEFEYTGAVQEHTLEPGIYKLQVWGAQGGSYNSTYQGGAGGYSEGILTVSEETKLFVYVGGQPASLTTSTDPTTGGFNGGGIGEHITYSGTTTYAQSGGGASDIRIGSDSLYARVIVAGGGGGASNRFNALTTRYGGGEVAGAYSSSYQATQTSGYQFGIGASSKDASGYRYVNAASGGGWYGGNAYINASDSTQYDSYNSGGSGYVYTGETAVNYPSGCLLSAKDYLTEAATIAGNLEIPTHDGTDTMVGNTGNGYAIITNITPPFEPEGPILRIELSNMTTEFLGFGEFVFDGVVRGFWENGSKAISGYTVSSPDLTTGGIKTVTVSYTDELGVTVSASYEIIVIMKLDNATTLAGLPVGSMITYDTTTTIDFAGVKARIQLYGQKVGRTSGGLSEFVIDTGSLPAKILRFYNGAVTYNNDSNSATPGTTQYRGDLIYGDTSDLYYRIAVAGNSGDDNGRTSSPVTYGGSGGGITGATGGTASLANTPGKGGSQTAGGAPGSSGAAYPGKSGLFGRPGEGNQSTNGTGGYGWYGGGGGSRSGSWGSAGGGGSGFIIGFSTTTYPSGYLGDDVDLQNTIASAISEQVLTRGGSSETSPKMILTIIEAGGTSPEEPTASIIQVYQNQQFNDANAYIYKDGEFRLCDVYRYNGSEFVKI